ncbi:MAG TPA: hypothetical protein VK457_13510, partial [Chloroflexota bacterium]|nr:hypothetical protein [Chloroflexota bacterium]
TVALGGTVMLSNAGVLSVSAGDGTIVSTGGQTPSLTVGTISNSNITDNTISAAKITNTAAVLSGGNTFTGGKQVLPASALGYAALNFPSSANAPSSPVTGDVWYANGEIHPQFRDNAGSPVTHSLMFTDDTIQNAQLQNSSINLSYGSGISGSSSVTLGGTLTLNNTGVLSNVAGTGISVSGGTGNVTISNTGVLSVAGDGAILTSTGGQNPVVSVASQSANKVLAGPTSGGPGAATFRALVAADVPDLGASYIKNGTSQQSSANFNIDGSGVLGGSLTANNAVVNQAADGNDLLFGKRFTDSSPTGNLMRFRDAGNTTNLWAVDVSGTLTAGNVPAARVSGTLSNSTTGNASTASAFDHVPTQCSSGFATGITATGAANCSTNGSTLTSLTAANISAGTAGINITGTASNVTGIVAVANGGTGLTSGTSGGIPGYTAAGTLTSSALLTNNAFVLGGGAGATPKTSTNYTTNGTGGMTLGVAATAAGSLTLAGSTSGGPTLTSQAVGGTLSLQLPSTAPTANQVMTATAVAGNNVTLGFTTPTTGTVTTTGSPASGNLTKFSGATSVTNGDLSGDCTTSGTLAITCTKTNGVSFAASATTDTTSASNINSGTLAIARIADASITNAKLANSSVTVTAGTGLSGGGAVALGGSVTLNNAGVTSLTGTANQVTVSASTG